MNEKINLLIHSVITMVIIILLYSLISNLYFIVGKENIPPLFRRFISPTVLPPIQKIFSSMYSLFFKGIIWEHISISLIRVVSGYSIGVLIGFTIGFMMAISRRTDLLLSPIYSFARAIPPIAFVTLFILWFGIGEFSKILLITYGVCMTMIVPTYHGVRDIPAIYIKASKMLGLNGKILFSKVVIPASLPRIFEGLRMSLMSAWGLIVAAELIASFKGVGYILISAQWTLDTPMVMVGVIIVGILGYILDGTVKMFSFKFTPWIERRR